jgi:hypothetical protein
VTTDLPESLRKAASLRTCGDPDCYQPEHQIHVHGPAQVPATGDHDLTVRGAWCNDDSTDLLLACSCGREYRVSHEKFSTDAIVPLTTLNRLADRHRDEVGGR